MPVGINEARHNDHIRSVDHLRVLDLEIRAGGSYLRAFDQHIGLAEVANLFIEAKNNSTCEDSSVWHGVPLKSGCMYYSTFMRSYCSGEVPAKIVSQLFCDERDSQVTVTDAAGPDSDYCCAAVSFRHELLHLLRLFTQPGRIFRRAIKD